MVLESGTFSPVEVGALGPFLWIWGHHTQFRANSHAFLTRRGHYVTRPEATIVCMLLLVLLMVRPVAGTANCVWCPQSPPPKSPPPYRFNPERRADNHKPSHNEANTYDHGLVTSDRLHSPRNSDVSFNDALREPDDQQGRQGHCFDESDVQLFLHIRASPSIVQVWQVIFASYVMDDHYTLAAARYVELNPVRAGIVTCAEDYPWSSARPHLVGRDDCLLKVAPVACAHRRLVIVSRQRRHSRGIAMAAQA